MKDLGSSALEVSGLDVSEHVVGHAVQHVVRHAAVVTAAGSSSRFNAGFMNGRLDSGSVKKEFLSFEGLPVLARAVKPFLEVPGLSVVVVTYKAGCLEETRSSLESLVPLLDGAGVPLHFVEGGDTRQSSVFNALSFLKRLWDDGAGFDLVSIHDGARPFVSKDIVLACLDAAFRCGGAAPCVPVSDTLVRVSGGFFSERLDRTDVCGVQTPQTFRFPEIYDAHVRARDLVDGVGSVFTDDTQIFMEFGGRVAAVTGNPKNTKITYRNDLEGGV